MQTPVLHTRNELEDAVLCTLAYSDIFDYPLTVDELHHFLAIPAERADVEQLAAGMKKVSSKDGYYYLAGRGAIVEIRKKRESASQKMFKRATTYGRILGALPFIRMVALTGSLAVKNCDKDADYDYMISAKSGRLWLARAFALLLNRIANLFGETLCPNLIVSENELVWKSENLYSAREFCQMKLIADAAVYAELRASNRWVESYFPNWSDEINLMDHEKQSKISVLIKKIIEFILDNKFGDYIEAWEMNRKIARFQNQSGFGVETRFSTDICQGNFDHHGVITMHKFCEKLKTLNVEFVDSPFQYLSGEIAN